MKNRSVIIACFALLGLGSVSAAPAGSAFTYQGRLTEAGAPYTGNAEFQATLWDAASDGSQVAANIPAQVIAEVTNGLFLLPLEFGMSPLQAGEERWLQLEVRTTLASFTLLSPRQRLAPSPYAITAGGLSGQLPATQLTGTLPSARLAGSYSSAVTFDNPGSRFMGDGSELTSLNAANLGSGLVPDRRLADNVARTNQVWLLGGNAGTTPGTDFLGTSDDRGFEFKVNGLRAGRLESAGDSTEDADLTPDGAPNVILGAPVNSAAAGTVGATVSGGGATNFNGTAYTNSVLASFGTIGGGRGNRIDSGANQATIAGGSAHTIHTLAANSVIGGGQSNAVWISSAGATIAGGLANSIGLLCPGSTIGGGANNLISLSSAWNTICGGEGNSIARDAWHASIAGGHANDIRPDASYAAIGGGLTNTIAGTYAAIPGGRLNFATNNAFAAGNRAKANHRGAFVWADSAEADFTSTTNNEVSFRCAGGMRLESNRGIAMPASDAPIITRGWDPFTADAGADKAGLGRWGLFMEPGYLVLGMPDRANRWVAISKYSTNGTRNDLVRIDQAGNLYTDGVLNPPSDRHAKRDFAAVDTQAVLARVASLPLQSWAYTNAPTVRHLGPVAQDFHAAFGLGTDDKHIATVDADGVALAAIQGLNQKLEQKNAALVEHVAELTALVKALSEKVNQGGR